MREKYRVGKRREQSQGRREGLAGMKKRKELGTGRGIGIKKEMRE